MDISTSREVWYIIASVCFAMITVFLCWALFEIARLVRRANHLVDEADTKLHELESQAKALIERATSITNYASLIGEGVKTVIGYVRAKSEMGWEDLEEEEDSKKKKRRKK